MGPCRVEPSYLACYSVTAAPYGSVNSQGGVQTWINPGCRDLQDRIRLRIPMVSITHSDLMPISSEESDAESSQCEAVIDISRDFRCLFRTAAPLRRHRFALQLNPVRRAHQSVENAVNHRVANLCMPLLTGVDCRLNQNEPA